MRPKRQAADELPLRRPHGPEDSTAPSPASWPDLPGKPARHCLVKTRSGAGDGDDGKARNGGGQWQGEQRPAGCCHARASRAQAQISMPQRGACLDRRADLQCRVRVSIRFAARSMPRPQREPCCDGDQRFQPTSQRGACLDPWIGCMKVSPGFNPLHSAEHA